MQRSQVSVDFKRKQQIPTKVPKRQNLSEETDECFIYLLAELRELEQ